MFKTTAPAAGLAAAALSPAFAAVAPFTETYDGGVYTVETPTVEAGSNAVLTLENDALTISVPGSTRTGITVDVPAATPATNLKVTQSIDFTFTAVEDSISRFGFVFAASPASAAGEGPADALYAYLREPANFRTPNFEIAGFDADTGFIDDDTDTGDVFTALLPNTAYSLTAAATFLSEDEILVEMILADTNGTLGSFSYTVQDVDADEGAITGTGYGLYVRNFDANSTIVVDNFTLTTEIVPEPTSLALISA
ncbi:MAG: hypothetical protein AAF078_05130, partial [Planctomycetota bacterium]